MCKLYEKTQLQADRVEVHVFFLLIFFFFFGGGGPHTVCDTEHRFLNTVTKGLVQATNETSKYYHPEPVWYLDERLLLTLTAIFLILPWLFFKKIGILSYTRFVNRACKGEATVVLLMP